MLRIWVIDSDEAQRTAICEGLARAGMDARGISGMAELRRWMEQPPDIVICSIDLRDESGLSVAAWLRLTTPAGVILLTDDRRREDRVLGLSLGVDHCLAQPVDLNELELLVRNLHRRLAAADHRQQWVSTLAADAATAAPAAGTAAWTFDASRWRLIAPTGEAAPLSLAEYLILRRLFEDAGNVVSRDALLLALKGRRISIHSRNLDMIVSRLRKKVERSCGERLPVLSARGIGYVFTGRCVILGQAGTPAASPRQQQAWAQA